MIATEQLIRRLRQVSERDLLAAEPDAALLRRFLEQRQERAFEELLRRHGPMVWALCVRSLGHSADAEDAFQAVFLLLVRKGASLRRPQHLAGWLCGTARKVVGRAQKQRQRRGLREPQREPHHEPARRDANPRDWEPLLDAAIQALPAKYREALILCELQQHGRSDAARLLGLAENTLSSRLARARRLLRTRLEGSGVALPALAGGLLTAAPAGLVAGTVQLALAGQVGGWSKILPLTLIPLMQGSSSMFLAKWLVGVAVLGFGLGTFTTGQVPAEKDANATPPVTVPAPAPTSKATPKATPNTPAPAVRDEVREQSRDAEKLQGRWIVKTLERGPAGPRNVPDQEFDLMRESFNPREVEFRGQELILLADGIGLVTKVELQTEFSPPRMNVSANTPHPGGNLQPLYGVYEVLDESRVRIRLGKVRSQRPSFEEKQPAAETVTIELQRAPRRELELPLQGKDWNELLGTWTITEAVQDGKAVADFSELIVERGRMIFRVGPMLMITQITIDATKNPAWMNLVVSHADAKRASRGIYKVEGDQLRLAISETSSDTKEYPRPSEFESLAGSKVMLFTAKRKAIGEWSVDFNATPRFGAVPAVCIFHRPTMQCANCHQIPDVNRPMARSLPQPVPSPVPRAEQAKPVASAPVEPPALGRGSVAEMAVAQREIQIPVQFRDEWTRAKTRAIRLMVSRDGGKTFTPHGDVFTGPREGNFTIPFQAAQSETVDFAIQTASEREQWHPRTEELRPVLSVRFVLPKVSVPALQAELPRDADTLGQENQQLRQELMELKKRLELLEKSKK